MCITWRVCEHKLTDFKAEQHGDYVLSFSSFLDGLSSQCFIGQGNHDSNFLLVLCDILIQPNNTYTFSVCPYSLLLLSVRAIWCCWVLSMVYSAPWLFPVAQLCYNLLFLWSEGIWIAYKFCIFKITIPVDTGDRTGVIFTSLPDRLRRQFEQVESFPISLLIFIFLRQGFSL